MLGAGGAARPVLVALADAGPDITVTVTARRPDAAAAAAALVGAATIAWTDRAEAAAAADPRRQRDAVGMDDGALPLDAGALRRGQVVADLVYHPLETPLLAAARAAGAVPVDGLGMLVHQAALQVEQWSGAVRAGRRHAGRGPPRCCKNRGKSLNFRAPAAEVSVSEGTPVLQGTFDTLSFSEVLRLLADARKTGALRMDAGVAATWWLVDGVCSAAEGGDLVEPVTDVRELLARMVDIGFVVARNAGGTFRFVADETPPWETEVRLEVEAVLVEIDGLLDQWREIEVVIPSLECRPVLCDELGTESLEVDAETWRLIVQIDRRRTVRDLAHRTSRSVFELCRTLIELVELGAVSITSRSRRARPSPSDAPRGTSTAAAGAVGAAEPALQPEEPYGPGVESPHPGPVAASEVDDAQARVTAVRCCGCSPARRAELSTGGAARARTAPTAVRRNACR